MGKAFECSPGDLDDPVSDLGLARVAHDLPIVARSQPPTTPRRRRRYQRIAEERASRPPRGALRARNGGGEVGRPDLFGFVVETGNRGADAGTHVRVIGGEGVS